MAQSRLVHVADTSIAGAVARAMRRACKRLGKAIHALRTDPNARERASAMAAFACIFAFGAVSLDYVITGGPDWNPGAAAAPLAQRIAQPSLATAPSLEPPAPWPELEVELDLIAYEAGLPADELLGGPDTISVDASRPRLVTTAALDHEASSEPVAPATEISDSPARKHKRHGA